MAAASDDSDRKYYFNTRTQKVERGMVSPWTHRLGPYETEQDALDAWQIVRKRNKDWEDQDRAYGKGD